MAMATTTTTTTPIATEALTKSSEGVNMAKGFKLIASAAAAAAAAAAMAAL